MGSKRTLLDFFNSSNNNNSDINNNNNNNNKNDISSEKKQKVKNESEKSGNIQNELHNLSFSPASESAASVSDTFQQPSESENIKQPFKKITNEYYKGLKLDADWLIKSFPDVLEKIQLGRRNGLKCNVCFRQITTALKSSKNGRVAMADGIRSDGTKELQRIIDHLKSKAHASALEADIAEKLWLSQSDDHPWIKILKKHEYEFIKSLIELAIDVHNDSQVMTLSANSWPSRSLAKLYANQQISAYQENGLDANFKSFEPSANYLHHRNPVVYREMLDTVAAVVMEKTLENLRKSVCFALQVDGSVDKCTVDNKFVTARYLNEEKALKNIFLGETHSEIRGADGLLNSVLNLFQKLEITDVLKEKLTGLTTDGESVNTGKNAGLWVKLKQFLENDVLCMWCVAHRADLVLEDLERSVMEVQHWKINLKAVSTFYRASALRTGELEAKCKETQTQFLHFPEFFEVRFAQHLFNLANIVWNNLPSMRLHWNAVLSSDVAERKEKAKVQGFLKIWKENGDQEYFTALMLDLLSVVEKLEKDCQRSMITLCDIEISKKIAIDSINLMEKIPFPGGYEEKLHTTYNKLLSENEITETETQRKKVNSLVTVARSREAVRNEMVLSVKEFLSQRLHLDQENIVKNMKAFLESRNSDSMIKASRDVVEELFGSNAVKIFSQEVISLFAAESLPAPSNLNNLTGILYHFLRVSERGTYFSKLVETYISLTPHSSNAERAVSYHTALKGPKQSSLSREAINSRMYIAINSPGTAHFDPRPAVARYLREKERRIRLPDSELYQNEFFTKRFFSKETTF